jgi:hypothetical protein
LDIHIAFWELPEVIPSQGFLPSKGDLRRPVESIPKIWAKSWLQLVTFFATTAVPWPFQHMSVE